MFVGPHVVYVCREEGSYIFQGPTREIKHYNHATARLANKCFIVCPFVVYVCREEGSYIFQGHTIEIKHYNHTTSRLANMWFKVFPYVVYMFVGKKDLISFRDIQ